MLRCCILWLILVMAFSAPAVASPTEDDSRCCGSDCGGAKEAALNRDYANNLDEYVRPTVMESDDCVEAYKQAFALLSWSGKFDFEKLINAICEAAQSSLDRYRGSLATSLGKWNSTIKSWNDLDDVVSGRLRVLLERELNAALSSAPSYSIPDVSPNGVLNALDLLR